MTDNQKRYFEQLKIEEKEELAINNELVESFKIECKKKGIILTKNNFKHIPTIGIVASYPNLIKFLCPEISEDKEGLFDFSILSNKLKKKPMINGFLFAKNFMLMAHPYFRRGFYEYCNFAPEFIKLFWNQDFTGFDSFIAIDKNRVRINTDDSSYFEFDTWFGPKFKSTINEIDDGTSKLCPPQILEDFSSLSLFNDVYCLDIKWETKDGIKSFQAEEFKTDNVKIIKDNKEFYPARYVHAEYTFQKNSFRHFDGAMHFYNEDEYYARRDSDFNYNSKSKVQIKTASEKLFKFNGTISIDIWLEYIGQFFAGNSLVIEYFEGKYPKEISEIIEAIRKSSND